MEDCNESEASSLRKAGFRPWHQSLIDDQFPRVPRDGEHAKLTQVGSSIYKSVARD
jgi:hypothetical protein